MTTQKYRSSLFSLALSAWVFLAAWQQEPSAVSGEVPPKWKIDVPARACQSAVLGTHCHTSSPAIADVNGDGRADIVLATNNGHILAVEGNGHVLWDTDTGPLFGVGGGNQSISSSPAVADIDRDGRMEIVVGAGSLETDRCRPGGVIVLNHQGGAESGWPRRTADHNVPPGNCPDPVYSTPALGDLDRDGDLEIVAGSFDTRVYAWHHNGAPVAGFPPPSKFYLLFGWSNVRDRLADTVWSSPALGDLTGDGHLDIVIGSDEGMVGSTHGGDWNCPYREPAGATDDYCGGTVYAWNRQGKVLPGFPKLLLEVIQSSPALVDVDGNGRPEVYVGTGSYYYNNSPDKPTNGFRVLGWNSDGGALPGWDGGRPTGGTMNAAPALGDIAGDNRPEVVIPGMDGKLYAWHHDGRAVTGFPMTPRNLFGDDAPHPFGKSPVLADYDGDGKMEVFLTIGWTVVVVDGDGRMLTNTNVTVDKSTPYYYTDGLLNNSPAVGDVDGDGKLELVAHNSDLVVWDLPGAGSHADWSMFRGNAARTGMLVPRVPPTLRVAPTEIDLSLTTGVNRQLQETITLRVPGASFRWEASLSSGQYLSLPKTNGSANGQTDVEVRITVPASLGPGQYTLGKVTVSVHGDGTNIQNNQQVVTVNLRVVRLADRSFIPVVRGGPGR
jgi:hypothetical protein